MATRNTQLPSTSYAPVLSDLLVGYYRSPDHPGKLRLLNWIDDLLGHKRIIAQTVGGFRLAIDHADWIQRRVLYEGVWEPEITALFRAELNSNDVFFDIGANVGYFTCLALRMGVDCAVAFEPDPQTFEILEMNVALNGFERSRVALIPKALSSEVQRLQFKRAHVANIGTSGFTNPAPVASFEVEAETLDHLILVMRLPWPTVVKIDVEGWEEQVLQGSLELLFKHPPRLILFEADCDCDGSIRNQRIVALLNNHGYSITKVERLCDLADEKENYVARLSYER